MNEIMEKLNASILLANSQAEIFGELKGYIILAEYEHATGIVLYRHNLSEPILTMMERIVRGSLIRIEMKAIAEARNVITDLGQLRFAIQTVLDTLSAKQPRFNGGAFLCLY